jgi:cobaltochelatase CobN
VQSFRGFLATELNTRLWNPRWIREMQKAGYAGARQFSKETENLYGFQATAPEQMSGQFWQNTFDVYVADKHGLGMERFFNEQNPHAQQNVLARLLEVDRQGSYRFSDADRGRLLRQYVRSVVAHGAGCSANTCGNRRLHEHVARQAALVPGLGSQELARFATQLTRATHWSSAQFAAAPPAFRAGLRQVRSPRRRATGVVSGQVVKEVRRLTLGARGPARIAVNGWIYAALGALVLSGACAKRLRGTHSY